MRKPSFPSTKGQRFPVEPWSDTTVHALSEICSKRNPCGIRNRAMIALLYGGGIRIGELLDMVALQIDTAGSLATIRQSKAGHIRTLPIIRDCLPPVEQWLLRRSALGFHDNDRLFCTLDGGPVSANYVRGMLKRIAKKAGIKKRVNPHGARHGFARKLHRNGFDTREIEVLLGHNTSQISQYLGDYVPADLFERVQRVPTSIRWKLRGTSKRT